MNNILISSMAALLAAISTPLYADVIHEQVLSDITRKTGGETKHLTVTGTGDRVVLTTSQAEVQIHQVIVIKKDGTSMSYNELLSLPENQAVYQSNGHIHYKTMNRKSLPTHMVLQFDRQELFGVLLTLESWGGYADVEVQVSDGPVMLDNNVGSGEEKSDQIGETCDPEDRLFLREHRVVCESNNLSVKTSVNSLERQLNELQRKLSRDNARLRTCQAHAQQIQSDNDSSVAQVNSLYASTDQAIESLRKQRLRFKYVRKFPSKWSCWARRRRHRGEFWGHGATPGQALSQAITKCSQSDGAGGKSDQKAKVRSACGDEKWGRYSSRRNGDIPRVGCTYNHNHRMRLANKMDQLRKPKGRN